MFDARDPLAEVGDYALTFRGRQRPVQPSASVEELRAAFCQPLGEDGIAGADVIGELIAAAEPGLVGNTDPNFFAWVMGSSDPVGVAADWLTSIWGQNAAIYQTAPSAAIAEEAAGAWLLELLDLPPDCSVGFVTGATMASFVGLAAARSEVLQRAGYDFERLGLQGAPFVHVFMSDDIHVSDRTALRHLGFGDANVHPVPSDDAGLMSVEALATAMDRVEGPKIIVAQAGHINSGGFEDFRAISELSKRHDAWLHVDGAFGLWARVLSEKAALTNGIELADSWAVDGHKWLQIPYDSGFAIVRDAEAHRRVMGMSAGYLNTSDDDGREPSAYVPGLSRRARGFAAWAVLKSLGKSGVREMVGRHCALARTAGERIAEIDGLRVVNTVDLNQVVVALDALASGKSLREISNDLNALGCFVRTTHWKGKDVLRLSFISNETTEAHLEKLISALRQSVS